MLENHTKKEYQRYIDEKMKWNTTCKCGHTTSISPNVEYIICSHCGKKLYNKKSNFKVRLLTAIYKFKE